MRHRPSTKWIPVLQYLLTQPVGVEIPWKQLNLVTDHDLKRHRGSLIRVNQELAQHGLTLGKNSATGIQVVPVENEEYDDA